MNLNKNDKIIYFDNASTTKPYDYLINLTKEYIENLWFNPSSIYSQNISNKIEETRKNILKYLTNNNLSKNFNVVFTPSATFSNNTVIFGLKNYLKNKNILIFNFEHPSLVNPSKQICSVFANYNIKTTFLNFPQGYNLIKKDHILFSKSIYDKLINSIDNNTGLVIISLINNENGFIFDIDEIAQNIKKINNETLILLDTTQAFLKYLFNKKDKNNFENYEFDLNSLNYIDFITASSHKFHSFRGTGILIYKENDILKPIIFGGGQEYKLYPSTENTLSILAINEVIKNEFLIKNNLVNDYVNVLKTRKYFIENIKKLEKKLNLEIFIFGENCEKSFSPYILKFFIKNIKSEVVVNLLSKYNIYASTSSACSSRKEKQINYEKDFGFPKDLADGGIRVSFSKFNNFEEVDIFLYYLEKIIKETFLIF